MFFVWARWGLATPPPPRPSAMVFLVVTQSIGLGPGTGVDGGALANKIRVVRDAVTFHGPDMGDGIETLRRLGGREIAAIAGSHSGRPVCAGSSDSRRLCLLRRGGGSVRRRNSVLDHCVLAHLSAEPGHRLLLQRLDRPALLDLGMRLGEGSGRRWRFQSCARRLPAIPAWRPLTSRGYR